MLSDIVNEEKWENIYCKTIINDCFDIIFYEKILNEIERVGMLKKGNTKNRQIKEEMTRGLFN